VLKPSEVSPLSALMLAQLVHEVGFPPGVVNVIHGTGAEAGAALVRHAGVDKITFTGRHQTGVQMLEAAKTDGMGARNMRLPAAHGSERGIQGIWWNKGGSGGSAFGHANALQRCDHKDSAAHTPSSMTLFKDTIVNEGGIFAAEPGRVQGKCENFVMRAANFFPQRTARILARLYNRLGLSAYFVEFRENCRNRVLTEDIPAEWRESSHDEFWRKSGTQTLNSISSTTPATLCRRMQD
jgi:hypothetical protein